MSLHIIVPEEYEAFNQQAPHVVQTTAWADFLRTQGKQVDLLMDQRGYLISYTRIPHTSYDIAYVQKSHIPSQDLISYIKTNRPSVVYIKCESQVKESPESRHELMELGFHKSFWNIFTPDTMFLNLSQDIDALYSKFNENTKRNIKKAQSYTIEERTDREAIDIFLELNAQTTKRQGYYTHADGYYIHMWDTMTEKNMACMLLAKHEDTYVGAIILFFHKDTLYYPYGASTSESVAKGAMARLQFEAIERAKGIIPSLLSGKNLTLYDMWGTLPKDSTDTQNPLYGVHRFKKGFGGDFVQFIGSYDYVIKPHIYYPFTGITKMRSMYYTSKKKIHRVWK